MHSVELRLQTLSNWGPGSPWLRANPGGRHIHVNAQRGSGRDVISNARGQRRRPSERQRVAVSSGDSRHARAAGSGPGASARSHGTTGNGHSESEGICQGRS